MLRELIAKNSWETAPAGTPAEWAMQSHDLGKAALLPPHGSVDEAYYRAQIPIVDQRLALAGVRLAAALNEVLIGSASGMMRSEEAGDPRAVGACHVRRPSLGAD